MYVLLYNKYTVHMYMYSYGGRPPCSAHMEGSLPINSKRRYVIPGSSKRRRETFTHITQIFVICHHQYVQYLFVSMYVFAVRSCLLEVIPSHHSVSS